MHDNDAIDSILTTISGLERKLSALRHGIVRDLRVDELGVSEVDLLSCRVVDSIVTVPLLHVQAVLPRCALAPLPEAPRWVAGMLDFHGDLIPALDLAARFYGEASPLAPSDVLLVCADGQRRGALLAQAIGQVHFRVPIESGNEVHEVPHGAYVMAVAHLGPVSAVVLSLARLFAALEPPGSLEPVS